MTIRRIEDLPPDLDKKISQGFNDLIRKIHAELSTKEKSPVYTGFFASSWIAQGSAVRAKDKIKR